MAESEGKKAAVYRSVSFKKLESWRSNRGEAQQKKSVDLEAAGVALPTKSGRAEEFWATRNVSVSRKVSKISATTAVLPTADPKKVVSTPFPSLSPSIRQLTEKFASSAGTRRSPPADGAPVTRGSSTLPRTRCSGGEGSRKSFHEDSSSFEDSDHKTAKSQSKRIKVKFGRGDDSGSESENKNEKRIFRRLSSDGSADSGKRDHSHISACPLSSRKTLSTDEEEDIAGRACKSHRSYLSTHHYDFSPLNSDNWPSVTKIRQIFDAKQSKDTQQNKPDDCEHLKAADPGLVQKLSPGESAPFSCEKDRLLPCSSANAPGLSLQNKCIVEAQSREIGAAVEEFCCGADFYSKEEHQLYSSADSENISSSDKKRLSDTDSFQSCSSSGHVITGSSHSNKINQSPCRSLIPCSEATHKTPRTTGLTSDPHADLQPPVTLSQSLSTTSCSSHQQATVREGKDRQGVGLPRDSLHSSHSSSTALAPTTSPPTSSASAPDKASTSYSSVVAPSIETRPSTKVASLIPCWKLSSGDEEEEHSWKRNKGVGATLKALSSDCFLSIGAVERNTVERTGYILCSKNGCWGTKSFSRSSGSEEDNPGSLGPHSREAVRRRSMRKKKKASGAFLATGRDDSNDHDGESEDSDSDTALTMEQLERHHHPNKGDYAGTRPRSHSVRESASHRAKVQQCKSMSSPAVSTTLPGVSRVSKVNIPPFNSSPGGSHCNSRYSSTETLKDEDQGSLNSRGVNSRTVSSSVLSKTYHGNYTMYRSPSFGHGDNFSRATVRPRPKVLPLVTSVPTVHSRQGGASAEVSVDESRSRKAGGNGVDNDGKNGISMSNPDITSETMSLLSFLKSDLSELKVRKPSGEKPVVTEGSTFYRMGSQAQGGTLLPSGNRPSLKDLTATLRRTKSFTYSDKPSTVVRRHLRGGSAKRSSSEQQLDVEGEKTERRQLTSDREVESDGGDFRWVRGQRTRPYYYYYDDDEDDEKELMPRFCERYVQEARQVIQDICQMSSREDNDDDADVRRIESNLGDGSFQLTKTNEQKKAGMKLEEKARRDREAEFENTKGRDKHEGERENRESNRRDGQSVQLEKLNSRSTNYREKVKRQTGEAGRALSQVNSEENMFYDRSVDELSGHESSLTDEGIVTEPEMAPSNPLEKSFLDTVGVYLESHTTRDVLGQPVTGWTKSALHDTEGCKNKGEDMDGINILNHSNCISDVAAIPSKLLLPHVQESNPDPLELSRTFGMSSVNAPCEDISANDVSQRSASNQGEGGGPDTPMTPIRRRRRFNPHGNNNNTCSDSSNSGNIESTVEAVGNGDSAVYRSFSDPMPQRCCSIDEEGNNNFSSVDSNMLGSLSVKGGGGCSPESSRPGYKGSMSSDLSVYSDSVFRDDAVHDYSGVIRSIVDEPGAMDRLVMDDNGNNKVPKKKSFSDPSRRSDAPLLSKSNAQFKGQTGSTEPICELDQSGQIPPSSSEPILSEQGQVLWVSDPEPKRPPPTQPHHLANSKNKAKNVRSQSECSPSYHDDEDDETDKCDNEQEMHKFNFDIKLAGILSPRMIRRPYRKRPNRLAQCFPNEDPLESLAVCSEPQEDHSSQTNFSGPAAPQNLRPRPNHVRYTSEPATFIPISPPLQPLKELSCFRAGYPPESCNLIEAPGGEAPPLDDVTRKPPNHDVKQSKAERDTESSGPLIVARDGVLLSGCERPNETTKSGITEAGQQRKNSEDTVSIDTRQKTKARVDMRRHVMMTLVDTEQSYVESLRTLIQGYMRPLKQPDSSSIVDPLLVDEIFYQIPEILEHHENFLEQVAGCVAQWHDRQTVGQILIQSFSKETIANMYSAYIDNFLNAKDAVRTAKEAKPAFHKFLEQSMRENKEKQALGDLMIKPVQRIPRYELLVKDLLKHTSEDHPDHPHLLDAQRNIKHLAEKINKGRRSAEEVEKETRVIQEIEAHIEGIEHILNPQRKFIRQEMVMEAKTVGGKKDRSLFLFSDLIICTTLKRKSGSLRRSSMSLYSAASAIDTSSKYKFLWKLPLEDVEVVKSSIQATNRESIQKMISRLDDDLSTLGQISKLSETLSFPHQSLDEAIKDLLASIHRELSEKQSLAFSISFLPTKLEFTTASAESSFVFEFTSPDACSNFEHAFEEAKKKLAMSKDQWDPEFLKAIPIMKTRSGMQFSCASPSHCSPDSGCEVWVCNSDGYVGQVCLLNIKDEPMVEACIAVCSARIICIAAVPGLKGRDRGSENCLGATPGHTQQQLHIHITHSSLELAEQPSGPRAELGPFDSDDTDDEDSPSPSSTLQSQASHSTISSSYGNDEGQCPKDMVTETTSSEEEQEFPITSSYGAPGMLGMGGGNCVHTDSPMDGRAMRRSSRGSFTRASLEDLLSIDPEAYQSSVWLGTEDGCIHVYQSSDNIRNRKNSMKMQHSSSILCVLYLDNKVFVSLAIGEVIVYQREAGSFWDPQSSQTLVLGTASNPITKMVPVGGKLWCGSQNRVLIINTTTLEKEHWFQVGTDSSRCVTCMVAYGQGVWLALQGSAQVRLYHAQSWESLTEVDVAPAVHKMLAGADAIIRQHKAACLRITALLACKDLLWIGTSAGVVLTLAIPAVSAGTSAASLKSSLVPMGSAHGHTGHVRFLTSIELPEGFDMKFPLTTGDSSANQCQSGSAADSNLHRRDSARRRTSAHLPSKTNHLVISGGDGYEDFRLTNSSETVGRDDSTNHLLLWRV